MKLSVRWECSRCGYANDPEGREYSWQRCVACNALRWPWLWWVLGGLCVVIIIILIFATNTFQKNPENVFYEQCKKYILGVEGQEGEVTQRELERIERIGERLGFSPSESEKLIMNMKKAILKDREDEYRSQPPGDNEITPEERNRLIILAERMGMSTQKPPLEPTMNEGVSDQPPESWEQAKAQATNLLKNGRFREAWDLLSRYNINPDAISLLEDIETPLMINLTFQYQHPGEKPSPIFPVNSENLSQLSLSHRDNYRLFFTPDEKAYLYIFQVDSGGGVTRLFPNPLYNLQENPIHAGSQYQFPSRGDDWCYLEELAGGKTEIAETIYSVASRWPALDLDEAYGAVHRATERNEREMALAHLKEKIIYRKDCNLNGIFFKEFVFSHAR